MNALMKKFIATSVLVVAAVTAKAQEGPYRFNKVEHDADKGEFYVRYNIRPTKGAEKLKTTSVMTYKDVNGDMNLDAADVATGEVITITGNGSFVKMGVDYMTTAILYVNDNGYEVTADTGSAKAATQLLTTCVKDQAACKNKLVSEFAKASIAPTN